MKLHKNSDFRSGSANLTFLALSWVIELWALKLAVLPAPEVVKKIEHISWITKSLCYWKFCEKKYIRDIKLLEQGTHDWHCEYFIDLSLSTQISWGTLKNADDHKERILVYHSSLYRSSVLPYSAEPCGDTHSQPKQASRLSHRELLVYPWAFINHRCVHRDWSSTLLGETSYVCIRNS